ncbi:hypothetical protein [Enterobacter cloacae]|uniref:hypothetical protein n=1 Tax=Enterobacter cloacae TaxID=550 RepID=UPI002A409BFB|nr:hypothetical protein [Enterobacter cloacae]
MFSFLRLSPLLFVMIFFTNLSYSAGGPDPWQLSSNNAIVDFNNYTEISYVSQHWLSTGKTRLVWQAGSGFAGYEIINRENYGEIDGYTIFKTGIPGVGAIYEVAFGLQSPSISDPPGYMKVNLRSSSVRVGSYSVYVDVYARAKLVAIPGDVNIPSSTTSTSITAPFRAWESDTNGIVGKVATFEFTLFQTQVIVPSCTFNATQYNIIFGDIQSYSIIHGGVKSGEIYVQLDCSKVPYVMPKFIIKAISNRVDNSSIYPDQRSDPSVADVKFTLFVENNPVDLNNEYTWKTVYPDKKYSTNFSALVSSLPGATSVNPGSITGRYELQTIYP